MSRDGRTLAILSLCHSLFILLHPQLLSGSADKTAKIWDLHSGQCLRTFEGHTHVFHAEFALEGRRVVTASEDGSLKLWEVATGRMLATFPGHIGVLCCSVWGPFAESSGFDGTLRTWLLPP